MPKLRKQSDLSSVGPEQPLNATRWIEMKRRAHRFMHYVPLVSLVAALVSGGISPVAADPRHRQSSGGIMFKQEFRRDENSKETGIPTIRPFNEIRDSLGQLLDGPTGLNAVARAARRTGPGGVSTSNPQVRDLFDLLTEFDRAIRVRNPELAIGLVEITGTDPQNDSQRLAVLNTWLGRQWGSAPRASGDARLPDMLINVEALTAIRVRVTMTAADAIARTGANQLVAAAEQQQPIPDQHVTPPPPVAAAPEEQIPVAPLAQAQETEDEDEAGASGTGTQDADQEISAQPALAHATPEEQSSWRQLMTNLNYVVDYYQGQVDGLTRTTQRNQRVIAERNLREAQGARDAFRVAFTGGNVEATRTVAETANAYASQDRLREINDAIRARSVVETPSSGGQQARTHELAAPITEVITGLRALSLSGGPAELATQIDQDLSSSVWLLDGTPRSEMIRELVSASIALGAGTSEQRTQWRTRFGITGDVAQDETSARSRVQASDRIYDAEQRSYLERIRLVADSRADLVAQVNGSTVLPDESLLRSLLGTLPSNQQRLFLAHRQNLLSTLQGHETFASRYMQSYAPTGENPRGRLSFRVVSDLYEQAQYDAAAVRMLIDTTTVLQNTGVQSRIRESPLFGREFWRSYAIAAMTVISPDFNPYSFYSAEERRALEAAARNRGGEATSFTRLANDALIRTNRYVYGDVWNDIYYNLISLMDPLEHPIAGLRDDRIHAQSNYYIYYGQNGNPAAREVERVDRALAELQRAVATAGTVDLDADLGEDGVHILTVAQAWLGEDRIRIFRERATSLLNQIQELNDRISDPATPNEDAATFRTQKTELERQFDQEISTHCDAMYDMALTLSGIREAELWLAESNTDGSALRRTNLTNRERSNAEAFIGLARQAFQWTFSESGEFSAYHSGLARDFAYSAIMLLAPRALESTDVPSGVTLIAYGASASNSDFPPLTNVTLGGNDAQRSEQAALIAEQRHLALLSLLRDNSEFGVSVLDQHTGDANLIGPSRVLDSRIGRFRYPSQDEGSQFDSPLLRYVLLGTTSSIMDSHFGHRGNAGTDIRYYERAVYMSYGGVFNELERIRIRQAYDISERPDFIIAFGTDYGYGRVREQAASLAMDQGNLTPEQRVQRANQIFVGELDYWLRELDERLGQDVNGHPVSAYARVENNPAAERIRSAVQIRAYLGELRRMYVGSLSHDLFDPQLVDPRHAVALAELAMGAASTDVSQLPAPPEERNVQRVSISLGLSSGSTARVELSGVGPNAETYSRASPVSVTIPGRNPMSVEAFLQEYPAISETDLDLRYYWLQYVERNNETYLVDPTSDDPENPNFLGRIVRIAGGYAVAQVQRSGTQWVDVAGNVPGELGEDGQRRMHAILYRLQLPSGRNMNFVPREEDRDLVGRIPQFRDAYTIGPEERRPGHSDHVAVVIDYRMQEIEVTGDSQGNAGPNIVLPSGPD